MFKLSLFSCLGVVLHLLALGLKDVLTFDFMSQPHEGGLKDALNQLLLLGAVESVESQKVNLTTDFLPFFVQILLRNLRKLNFANSFVKLNNLVKSCEIFVYPANCLARIIRIIEVSCKFIFFFSYVVSSS